MLRGHVVVVDKSLADLLDAVVSHGETVRELILSSLTMRTYLCTEFRDIRYCMEVLEKIADDLNVKFSYRLYYVVAERIGARAYRIAAFTDGVLLHFTANEELRSREDLERVAARALSLRLSRLYVYPGTEAAKIIAGALKAIMTLSHKSRIYAAASPIRLENSSVYIAVAKRRAELQRRLLVPAIKTLHVHASENKQKIRSIYKLLSPS